MRKLLTLALMACLTGSAALSVSVEAAGLGRRQQSAVIRRLKQNERRLQVLRQKAQAIQQQERNTKQNITHIQQDLETAAQKLADSQTKYELAHQKVIEVTKKLADAEQDWEDQLEAATGRLRQMYKNKHYASVNALLESQNFSVFMRKTIYFKYLAQKDKHMLDDLKAQRKKLATFQYENMLKRQVLGKRAHEQAENKAKFQYQKAKQIHYLAALKREKDIYMREVRALESESRKITRMLEQMLARRQTSRVSLGTGRFTWPIPGAPMTSTFGNRVHPIFGHSRMHTGIDIGAGAGTPIRAVDSGVVIESGWRGGYGKTVIIDHGQGIVTLYGHTSAYYVRAGQSVRKGQTIAAVGSTGFSTGPHLHLEVRRNGVPINPSGWF